MLKKREELLNQSLAEARRMRASAENEYRSRVDESELVKEATKQAEKIVEEAQQKAQHVLDLADNDARSRRDMADQYAQEVLYKLEQEIAGVLTTVRHGIDALEPRQSTTAR